MGINMTVIRSFVLTMAAVAVAGLTVGRADAADKVRVTYASVDALYAPYFLGVEKGYFKSRSY